MIDVLLQRFADFNYILEVKKDKLSFHAEKDHVDALLEYPECVTNAERSMKKAVETIVGRERSLIIICDIHFDLPIFAISIQRQKAGHLTSETLYLSMSSIGYEFRWDTTLRLRKSMQNKRLMSSFGTNNIGAAHFFCASYMAFSSSILSITAFPSPCIFNPAKNVLERTEAVSGCNRPILCFATVMWPR